MDQPLNSSQLTTFTGDITNDALLETQSRLRELAGHTDLPTLQLREGWIAVPVKLKVELPPLGPVAGLDIKEQEPILIGFSLGQYPSTAPNVYTNRPNFPKSIVPHMYLPTAGLPAGFCLIKGGSTAYDEWYANKTIKDVLIRVANWLRDAGAGMLAIDGGQYDPLRLVSYTGYMTYDYDHLARVVRQKSALSPGSNFACLQLEDTAPKSDQYSWHLRKIVSADQLELATAEEKAEGVKESDDRSKKMLYRGFLLWANKDEPIYDFDVDLPFTWESFKFFCDKHLIDPGPLEQELIKWPSAYITYPIIVAIKRPLQVLGFSDSIEFVNFDLVLRKEAFDEKGIRPEIKLSVNKHLQPLTAQKAQAISAFTPLTSDSVLVAGAGALGSKVVLHHLKSGRKHMFVADTNTLLPHHMVRHGLGTAYLFQNKANALGNEAKLLFPDEPQSLTGLSLNAEHILTSVPSVEYFDWIYDFTAATPFFHRLIKAKLSEKTKVAKGYISDFGNLGILMIEGPQRNPRVDDLQILLYQQALKEAEIQKWLQREAAAESSSQNILIGVGCSTDTTVLAGDMVSLHAAWMSGQLKQEIARFTRPDGLVFLNRIQHDPYFAPSVTLHMIQPLSVIAAVNDPQWQVRFAHGILDDLKTQMQQASPIETGGILVGCANHKTKTIHVTDTIAAPPDSTANEVCFCRGKEGLAKAIQHIVDQTGRQLGYIGEWHSHPEGPNGMSRKDDQTVDRFKREYSQEVTPLPVFLLIVTPDAILPFVF